MRIGTVIDRAIGVLSPAWAARRMAARATMEQIEAYSVGKGGYAAGRTDRLTRGRDSRELTENKIPREQIDRMRIRSWTMFRDNVHVRKIVTSLVAKIVGRGPNPQFLATTVDGKPHREFRQRAAELVRKWSKQCDYRGPVGRGGSSLRELAKTAKKQTILSGEVLVKKTAGNPVGKMPGLKIQLIHANRLRSEAEFTAPSGNKVIFGIELKDDRRVAYHFSDSAQPIPADRINHVYVQEDVDQLRGVPWLSAPLMKTMDLGDYEFNELTAAAMSSCVVMGIRRPTGATGAFGVAHATYDNADAAGNTISNITPGMIADLGRDGELVTFNPARPNSNIDPFIGHQLRSIATGAPGTKGSTVSGDYRNSSFSSERSADNDNWPELEGVQDWWGESFYAPIIEELIVEAVNTGWFDGIVTPEEFANRKDNYLAIRWGFPVARSINPVDDATSSRLRVQNGQRSVQAEAAMIGEDWEANLQSVAEFLDRGRELGIPDDFLNQMLGIAQADQPEPAEPTATDDSAKPDDEDDGENEETLGGGRNRLLSLAH